MANPALGYSALLKSNLPTRAGRKTDQAKAIEAARRKAYREVERRDGLICRACRRMVTKTLTLRDDRLEHHHVNGRGTLEHETTENIAVTCKGCQDDRHVRRTLHITGNANKRLRCEQNGHVWYSEARR